MRRKREGRGGAGLRQCLNMRGGKEKEVRDG